VIQRRDFLRGLGTTLSCVTGCEREEPSMTSNRPADSLAQLGAELDLQLLFSARVAGVRRISGGVGGALKVKVELPGAELPALLEQIGIEPESFELGTGGLLGPDREFWNPHQAPALRTGQTKRAAARAASSLLAGRIVRGWVVAAELANGRLPVVAYSGIEPRPPG
jgi:hypothetical protein